MINCNPVRVDEEGLLAVKAALDSGMVAKGPFIDRLQRSFSEVTGVEHSVAVANGTVALVLAAMATGIAPGDTVLVSSFSFAATANAFLSIGCEVVAVDVDPQSYNISGPTLAHALEDHPDARALVVVDLFGSTADTDGAIASARDHGLTVIEDAAQAIGAHTSDGSPIGERADATTFSLYATKNIFGGEGGVVVTPRSDVATVVRSIADHQSVEIDGRRLIGLNYRMNELGAALAGSQMQNLGSYIERRRARATRLAKACTAAWGDAVVVPVDAAPADDPTPQHVFHQFTVLATDGDTRVRLQERLGELGIETRRFYPYTLAELPGVQPSDVPNAAGLAARCFSLPIAHSLTDEEFEIVLGAVEASSPAV